MKYLLALFAFGTLSVALTQTFPDDWIGSYEGDMLIAQLDQPTDTIPVSLELVTIETDSVWSYKMTFYSEKYGTIIKDYKIVAKSKNDAQNYYLDENNGVVMGITLMDGTFYGMYEVLEMTYISTIQYRDGNLYLDLFAAPKDNPLITKTDGEEPIMVTSYPPNLHQTALFKRIP